MSRWTWAERGVTVTLEVQPGGAYALTLDDDGLDITADLPVAAVRELLDHLVGAEGYEALEVALEGALEARDAAESEVERVSEERDERVAALEAQLREALATVEQHKTALDLADQRTRGLERDVDRMRAAGLPS